MMNLDIEELFYAASELGAALGADEAERAWPSVKELAEKLEREDGMRPVLALAHAAMMTAEAA